LEIAGIIVQKFFTLAKRETGNDAGKMRASIFTILRHKLEIKAGE
jgi:hypothetical protein